MVAHAGIKLNKPVLLFSLEMSHLELTQRLLCSEARVDANRMRTGKLLEADWPKIGNAISRMSEAPIFIDDNPNLTVMDIRARARRLKSREGLGLVVVDYLQLMTGRHGAENRQVEVSEISRGLKILARELEVPVVALSQLSRGLEMRQDKRPMLADLRESGSIEQDSDVVLFIYRDEIYNPESTESQGTAEIIVAKHRNGPTGLDPAGLHRPPRPLRQHGPGLGSTRRDRRRGLPAAPSGRRAEFGDDGPVADFVLPRIPASAGALIATGPAGSSILKPTYKSGWTIPGGQIEADGESPWEGCRREVLEETGLTVTSGRLACVDFLRPRSRPARGAAVPVRLRLDRPRDGGTASSSRPRRSATTGGPTPTRRPAAERSGRAPGGPGPGPPAGTALPRGRPTGGRRHRLTGRRGHPGRRPARATNRLQRLPAEVGHPGAGEPRLGPGPRSATGWTSTIDARRQCRRHRRSRAAG